MKSFLYQGQYYDFETKLAYNRFSYYNPETGVYISQDPIRLNGNNPNLYTYVEDSNWWVDVFGLSGRGAEVHKKIQQELKNRLSEKYGGENVKDEGRIKLSNDMSRFGDVVVYDPKTGNIKEVHQIGDLRIRGNYRPSSRERGAIMDIRETLGDDVKIIFHDKKEKVTLIDPDKYEDWKVPKDKHRKLKGGCKENG